MARPSLLDGIDMSDPCAVWPKLEEALNRLLVGEMAVSVSFGEDEVRFQESDTRMLRRRVSQLKAECRARSTGTHPDLQIVSIRNKRGWA
tara:strand:- start:3577 stop:3846 length:270 start_codon:yes stop_codon:yes gene_type:complete